MSTESKGSQQSTAEPGEQAAENTTPEVEASDDSAASELSLDLLFEVLKNSRRREVIRYLREHEDETTLSDVAEHIAALENDTTVRSLTSDERKRVYVGLYQCHLPKMADMGVVDFNKDRGKIALGPNAPQLYEYIDSEDEQARDWHKYYLGLSGVGLAAVVLSVAIGGGTVLGPAGVAGALCVAIASCASWQALAERDTERAAGS